MAIPVQEHAETGQSGTYAFEVDDRSYTTDRPALTGGEIMDRAGIPRATGLLLVLQDGTQRSVRVEEMIELEPGRHFKKPPRFKRG